MKFNCPMQTRGLLTNPMVPRQFQQAKIIRDDRGRECLKFVTPSGVTAYVDPSITMPVIEGFIRKLEAKLARRRQKRGC